MSNFTGTDSTTPEAADQNQITGTEPSEPKLNGGAPPEHLKDELIRIASTPAGIERNSEASAFERRHGRERGTVARWIKHPSIAEWALDDEGDVYMDPAKLARFDPKELPPKDHDPLFDPYEDWGEEPPRTKTKLTKAEIDAKVAEIAKLGEMEYERVRNGAAAELGMRVSRLDKFVKREKSQPEDNRAGSPITFPAVEQWHEPVELHDVIEEIITELNEHFELPTHADIAIALWAVFSWWHDVAEISPRLAILSPVKGCGKTQLGSAILKLVEKPKASSSMTEAAFFRIAEKYEPTFFLDELDSVSEGMRTMLNSGITRDTAKAYRTVGEDYEPREFNTWCPIIIAAIGSLPGTLMDRSIVINMVRKGRGTKLSTVYANYDVPELRSKLARLRQDNEIDLKVDPAILPVGLNDRAANCWFHLISIAKHSSEDHYQRACRAALGLSPLGEDRDDDLGTMLLSDIRDIFDELKTSKITSDALVRELLAMKHRPWGECKGGRALTPHNLWTFLKVFTNQNGTKVRAMKVWVGGKPVQGYKRRQFEELWVRYLEPAGKRKNTRHLPRRPEG